MIITEKIKVKIYSTNIKHFKSLGYDCNVKDTILVDVKELMKQSTILIHVKCDICENEKIIQYRKYINNCKNKGFYVCSLSCAQTKIKLTKIENHGDPNFSGIEKRNKTCKELYDNEFYKNVKQRKETNLEKYGFEHVMMNNEIKEKRKETFKEIYGEDHPMKNSEIISKKKKTSKILYNDENYTNREKIMKTKLDKYDDPHYFNLKKGMKTKLEKGLIISNEKLTDWQIYKKLVKNLTSKNKNLLFELWDGFDFYDNEYIKENLQMTPTNRLYPTIDHKISVYYGFCNDIDFNIIGDIENLCITKKHINSSKGSTCS